EKVFQPVFQNEFIISGAFSCFGDFILKGKFPYFKSPAVQDKLIFLFLKFNSLVYVTCCFIIEHAYSAGCFLISLLDFIHKVIHSCSSLNERLACSFTCIDKSVLRVFNRLLILLPEKSFDLLLKDGKGRNTSITYGNDQVEKSFKLVDYTINDGFTEIHQAFGYLIKCEFAEFFTDGYENVKN